jgi:hypothetical protein
MPAAFPTGRAGDADGKELASLVARLGNPDPQAREEAAVRLTAAGPAALPALREAARTKDAALKKRAEAVILAIGSRAKKKVEEHLAKLKAAGAVVRPQEEPVLASLFPTRLFYAAVFRQYPVAIRPPPPLKVRNIFVYSKDGSLKQLSSAKELTDFFRTALRPAANDNVIKDVTRAWVALAKEFHQDGFFRFTIPKDVALKRQGGGKQAVGRAVVMPLGGNQGYVQAALVFDASGRLSRATDTAKLKAGVRPVCQATKLLDPDPVVRRMAEKDILVMGRAAKEYLDEQRAKARPALRRAIDRVWNRILDEGW